MPSALEIFNQPLISQLAHMDYAYQISHSLYIVSLEVLKIGNQLRDRLVGDVIHEGDRGSTVHALRPFILQSLALVTIGGRWHSLCA